MRLADEDAALFYQLMRPLLFFVNQQCKILPDYESLEDYVGAPPNEQVRVRNALYENPHLLDAFVAENPAKLPADELEIMRRWRDFVPGSFLIERYLRKGTIFIGTGSASGVYGVLGLTETLEEMLWGRRLPVMITKSVLLPFKGHIVHDGFFELHNVFFGPGTRNELKESYMAAKHGGRVIWTLEEPQGSQQKKRTRRKPDRDWRPIIDELVTAAEQLKGGQAPMQGPAFGLLKASAFLAQAAVHSPDDLETLQNLEKRVVRAVRRVQRTLGRAWR